MGIASKSKYILSRQCGSRSLRLKYWYKPLTAARTGWGPAVQRERRAAEESTDKRRSTKIPRPVNSPETFTTTHRAAGLDEHALAGGAGVDAGLQK